MIAMIKRCLFIFLFLGILVGLGQLIEMKTRGFSVQKIQADDIADRLEWEGPAATDELSKILSQPFRLIGAGSECFAFISEDGTAVIKFFKLYQMRPVYFHKGFIFEDHSAYDGSVTNRKSPDWLKRFHGIREFRIQRTFNSIKLAYDELKEETGLIYLHLNTTDDLHRNIALYDANEIRHEIDADASRFYIQKTAALFDPHFKTLQKEGRHTEAKASIDSLLQLIINRCQKGIADRDVYAKNLGFIGTRAIEIDTGSFHKEPCVWQQELFFSTLELKKWCSKNYPEMASYLESRVLEEIKKE